jgi:hypothetical protein
VKHPKQGVRERSSRLLPCSREPALAKDLRNERVAGVVRTASTVRDLDLVHPVHIVDSEISEGRYGGDAVSAAVVQLYDQSQRQQRGRLEHSAFEDLRQMSLI